MSKGCKDIENVNRMLAMSIGVTWDARDHDNIKSKR